MNSISYKEVNISKKLLSEVLDIAEQTINKVYINYNKIIITFYASPVDGIKEVEINIYELAHRCKEWAFNEFGYVLQSSYWGEDDNAVCIFAMHDLEFHGKTEYDAIFKACEWILKQEEIK